MLWWLSSCILTGSLLLASPAQGAALPRRDSAPVVAVKNGSYAGVYSSEYGQEFFLGMPYAQTAERFKLAQPLNTTWSGTRDATAYPPECVGYGSDDTDYTSSEDCLYLNVIRPAGISADADLPVAVWIHGGGLYMGGSADKRYNLSFIVENSVEQGTPMVAVSINYRLSAYGFLCGQETLDAGIANNGFRDQRQALRWVNENIAAFGGSPDKVTIWGESAGAESVSAQMLAYNGRDDGLFRGAIAESGFGGILYIYAGGLNATDAMQDVYDLLVTNTSCASYVNTSASLDCLRNLPFDELNAALNGTDASPWSPMLDGDFIADYPANQLRDGNFPRLPIMIGTNTDEGSAFGSDKGVNDTVVNTDEEMAAAVALIIGSQAPQETGKTIEELVDEILALYPNIQAVGDPGLDKFPVIVPGDEVAEEFGLQYRRCGAFFGDNVMQYMRRRSNLAWDKYNVTSYSYRFDVVVNGVSDVIGATHFQEVAFVFDNVNGDGYSTNPFENEPATFTALAKTMSKAWVNFVTSLNPNGENDSAPPDGITWPAYNATVGGGVGQNIVWSVNGSYLEYDDFRAEGINWQIENSLAVFGL